MISIYSAVFIIKSKVAVMISDANQKVLDSFIALHKKERELLWFKKVAERFL